MYKPRKNSLPLYKRTAPVIEQTNEAQQKDLPTQTVAKPFYRGIRGVMSLPYEIIKSTIKRSQKANYALVGSFYELSIVE